MREDFTGGLTQSIAACQAFKRPGIANSISTASRELERLAAPPEGSRPAEESFRVDLSKPLVFQVGHLLDRYDEWIHQPIVHAEAPLFFQNSFIEAYLSRTPWWLVPTLWLPVVVVLLCTCLQAGVGLLATLYWFALGLVIWSLIEYSLHRFLFHKVTTSYWSNTLHFLFHGCHHKHPMDAYRLVFPPALTVCFLVPLWGIRLLLFPEREGLAVFAGGMTGYVCYDMTHYFLHHGHPAFCWIKSLKNVGYFLRLTCEGIFKDLTITPSKQEVPLEPPLQASISGVWHYIIFLGLALRDAAIMFLRAPEKQPRLGSLPTALFQGRIAISSFIDCFTIVVLSVALWTNICCGYTR